MAQVHASHVHYVYVVPAAWIIVTSVNHCKKTIQNMSKHEYQNSAKLKHQQYVG